MALVLFLSERKSKFPLPAIPWILKSKSFAEGHADGLQQQFRESTLKGLRRTSLSWCSRSRASQPAIFGRRCH